MPAGGSIALNPPISSVAAGTSASASVVTTTGTQISIGDSWTLTPTLPSGITINGGLGGKVISNGGSFGISWQVAASVSAGVHSIPYTWNDTTSSHSGSGSTSITVLAAASAINPVWMTVNATTRRLYVLDTGLRVVWVFDLTQPNGSGPLTHFDISSITVGIPKIDVIYGNNTVWLSDGVSTLFSLDGVTGAITSYNESAHLFGTIVDFTINISNDTVYVSDTGNYITSYNGTGAFTTITSEPSLGGLTLHKMNPYHPNGQAVGFTASGVIGFVQYGFGNIYYSTYTLETSPTPFSVTLDAQGYAYVSAEEDVNGTGDYAVSVWYQPNQLVQNAPQAYKYTWPGVGFAGYLVGYAADYTTNDRVFGLDTEGALYLMDGGPVQSFPMSLAPPLFQPTLVTTFPTPCLSIVSDAEFERTNSVNPGTFIWALGEANSGVYRYNVATLTHDLTYQYAQPAAASIVGLASVTALGGLLKGASAHLVGAPSLSASLTQEAFLATSIRGFATISATATLVTPIPVHAACSLAASATLVATGGTLIEASSNGTSITVTFAPRIRIEGVINPASYVLQVEHGAVPITILGVTPTLTLVQQGAHARVLSAYTVQLDGSFTAADLGAYLFFTSAYNRIQYARIEAVSGSILTVDQPLFMGDPANGSIPWTEKSLNGLVIQTSKQTNGIIHSITPRGLQLSAGEPFPATAAFVPVSSGPSVTGAVALPEGQIIVTFSEPMLPDSFLTDPSEYAVTGPSAVTITSVRTVSPTQVALQTNGLITSSFTLTVNAAGTPHDIAGNPINPAFNEAVFDGFTPLTVSSVFVDYGPITKAPNVLQAGAHATIVDPVTINFADGNLDSSVVGLLVTLSGGTKNGGTFTILSVLSAKHAKVTASFTIPDSTVMSWKVFNPLDGEIADDPSDVTVTINGIPTTPVDVIGLLGQIVLATPPSDGDTVLVDYNWVQNPVIDLRRLNSKEFRLNSWNRDLGYIPDESRHKYRYNNTLVVPSEYTLPTPLQTGTGAQILTTTEFNLPGATLTVADTELTVRIGGINGGDYIIASIIDATHLTVAKPVQIFPDPGSGTLSWEVFDPNNSDERAPLAQPLQRDLKYRAYERAYTALMNDPSTLLFNSPIHKIAFPPLSRSLSPVVADYQATVLPENNPLTPWTRNGSGTAAIVSNELVVTSSSAGPPFPSGQPIFWTQPIDLTFQNVFAAAWRLTINADPSTEGVFTGVAAGYSDSEKCVVVGFLDVAGTHMIGILQAGAGNDPSQLAAWTGGLDASGNATGAPVAFDWSTVHSYRLYTDQDGNISVFVDGGVIATLMIEEGALPFLSELNEPFNKLQGVYFGALSRLATSTSIWDFFDYQITPTNPEQFAPSVYVSFEADSGPENAPQPWTPLGAHGTETIPYNGLLILDSTSATDAATETLAGLVDGDFRGFMRIEPLLSAASSIVLDVNVQLLTFTQGIAPDATMVAIDDGTYLIQLCFFPGRASPLFSYGGRSFPDEFEPYTWTKMGGQTPTLIGQLLRITDASTTDGLLYFIDDNPVPTASTRVVSSGNDYILEFRVRVNSHTPDPAGFSGVNAEVYDSLRDVGVMFLDVAGTLSVALHSDDGTHDVIVAQFLFNWNDGNFHTYRIVKSTAGNLVSLFIDTVLIGTAPYSGFLIHTLPSPVGTISFGSTLPQSVMALSVVDWVYCNAWRVNPVIQPFVGLWRGYDPNSLTGYHLPLKTSGTNARVAGNGVEDPNADFVADGVVPGDVFIVDVGPNKNVYEILSVAPTILTVSLIDVTPIVHQANAAMQAASDFKSTASFTWQGASSLAGSADVAALAGTDNYAVLVGASSFAGTATVHGHARVSVGAGSTVGASATATGSIPAGSPFPSQPSQVNYRIPATVDWAMPHRYRIARDPSGGVAVFLDSTVAPLINVGYNNIDLPRSTAGLPNGIADGLPSITWGAFDPTNLSQTAWQYVRYGITRPASDSMIVPPHQVLNQRNIINSYERHTTNIPHTLTDFWSESEGIPPQTEPDLLRNPNLTAYTLLNEGTPLVPSTQTYEVRRPTPILVPIVGFNNIKDILNAQAFVMNESEQRIELLVPDDVLYNSLEVIERDTGSPNLIAPFNDESQPLSYGTLSFQNTICLTYDAQTLPELDATAATPWTFEAADPSHVTRTVFGGVLTYGTDGTGTTTAYSNNTPLPDCPSLTTQVSFRLKLLNDASGGLGDSQVRFGLSAPGFTVSLAFVTLPNGRRYVLVIDQNSGLVVGGTTFDFLDGNFHSYRIVRNPTAGPPGPPPQLPGLLQVFIDS